MSADWPVNRPLCGLKAVSSTIATDINDLPATQPARKVLKHYADNLRVLTDPDKAYGTATAHQIECFLLVGPGVVRSSIRGLQYEGPASALSR